MRYYRVSALLPLQAIVCQLPEAFALSRLGVVTRRRFRNHAAFLLSESTTITTTQTSPYHQSLVSSTALFMARSRGLEVRKESSTPTEGGMTLYCKAGPDGTSVGDCPFAHFVRMVLEEKSLDYEVKPCVQETKPQWLIDHYDGKMPALRHRKECYVESSVIADYLEFFFASPPMKGDAKETDEAEQAVAGLFPATAKYLKHTPDGDSEDEEIRMGLVEALGRLEAHLNKEGRTGPYLVGNGEQLTLIDCSLTPKLYHLSCGLEEFKKNAIDIGAQFPKVRAYMDTLFARESFDKTKYPQSTVIWGWSNARDAAAKTK